jgi:hypothetical protein
VTPENEFAKRHLRYSTCFNAGFSGSPNGRPAHATVGGSNLVHKPGDSIRDLESERTMLIATLTVERPGSYVPRFLFRGQGSSAWGLKTTLERQLPNMIRPRVCSYYRKVSATKPEIEAVTGRRWTIPSLDEFSHALAERELLTLPEFSGVRIPSLSTPPRLSIAITRLDQVPLYCLVLRLQ